MATVPVSGFPRLALGVSACLLGEPVRYDGGHKRHEFVTGPLAAHADYVPVCPEAAIGLGIPRPPIHLVGPRDEPRALGLEDPALDVTADLRAFGLQTVDTLGLVSGYIFKKNSPSCGLRGVKLHDRPGHRSRHTGTGIFAATVRTAMPLLPLEEEDGLDEPARRDSFLLRVYVYRRWQDLLAAGLDQASLAEFHAAHSLLLMAHSRAAHARLNRLLGNAREQNLVPTADAYIRDLLATLARPASRTRHLGVLHTLADRVRPQLSPREKASLARQLADFGAGRHHLRELTATIAEHMASGRHDDRAAQHYLHPYPESLRCNNY